MAISYEGLKYFVLRDACLHKVYQGRPLPQHSRRSVAFSVGIVDEAVDLQFIVQDHGRLYRMVYGGHRSDAGLDQCTHHQDDRMLYLLLL